MSRLSTPLIIVCLPLAALLDGPLAAEAPFTAQLIDANPPARPYYKMAGDLDGDGQIDVIVAGAKGPLVWYRYPDWKKSEIAASGWDGVNGELGDVDQDGDLDIVMGGLIWLSNPRLGGGSWTTHQVDRQRAHDIELGDLNRDGQLEIVARDQSAFGKAGNQIYLYWRQDAAAWRKAALPCPHGEGLKLDDLDGDGDPDIVIGGRWYENLGEPEGGSWPEHVFTSAWTEEDAKVETADINGDGRLDVVLTPAELKGDRYRIAWYEAPADARQADWREHVVAADIETVIHSLAVGDFDRDGALDIAIAEMHQGADPDEVAVFYRAEPNAPWRKQVLSRKGSHDLIAADIDGDGDLDLIGANHAGDSHPLELWRNESAPSR